MCYSLLQDCAIEDERKHYDTCIKHIHRPVEQNHEPTANSQHTSVWGDPSDPSAYNACKIMTWELALLHWEQDYINTNFRKLSLHTLIQKKKNRESGAQKELIFDKDGMNI